jgi:VTC domain
VSALDAPVARLDAIGLAELVDRAALQTRVDRKYVLPLRLAGQVVTELARAEDVRVLEIGGLRCFGYESLYYDTPDLAGYHLAARGRRRRFKVRRRTHLESGDSFMEVKTRGSRGATVKERISATDLQAGRAFVGEVLDEAGLGWVSVRDLRPTLRTRYRRTTLYLPATDGRVTVDTDLAWSLPGGPEAVLDGVAIVETKSAAAASSADRRLWRSGHRPSRVSKYGTGLAALRGDLPDNKWCPVLRRHFSLLAPCSSDDRTTS